MEFEVYRPKGAPTYLVKVGNDVYEMNDHPTSPNGVNMFVGDWSEFNNILKNERPLKRISPILVNGIMDRIKYP